MTGKEREADDEQEQVGREHPFVAEMTGEPGEPGVAAKRREGELVGDDDRQADDRNAQRMAVQDGDAEQDRREQDEVDRDAEQGGTDGMHDRVRHRVSHE